MEKRESEDQGEGVGEGEEIDVPYQEERFSNDQEAWRTLWDGSREEREKDFVRRCGCERIGKKQRKRKRE